LFHYRLQFGRAGSERVVERFELHGLVGGVDEVTPRLRGDVGALPLGRSDDPGGAGRAATAWHQRRRLRDRR
jgi:hypothetical protein